MVGRDMDYSMIIQRDPRDNIRDNIYLVTVPELPGCVTHGATYEEAVAQQGQDAIVTSVYGEDPATLPAPNLYPLDDDEDGGSMSEHPASTGSAAAS